EPFAAKRYDFGTCRMTERNSSEPFAAKRYDFGTCRMTERNSSYIGTMLKGRLTPPPRQTAGA
ncbi:hypothetical protein T484DRAFT_1862863, partial [Baffinella frigidus]